MMKEIENKWWTDLLGYEVITKPTAREIFHFQPRLDETTTFARMKQQADGRPRIHL